MKYDHRFELRSFDGVTALFGCGDLNARLDFLRGGVRVALWRKGERLFPTFTVCPDGEMPEAGRERLSLQGFETVRAEMAQNADAADFTAGELRLHVTRKNFELSWYQREALLFKDREVLAYNLGGELGRGSAHYLSREPGEQIFGLGDKTGDVDKAGRSFRLGTADAMGFDARSSDPLYKHIPFYICRNSAGSYGIYYDSYSDGSFDFGREIDNYFRPFKSFRCEEEALVYYVFFGTPEEIVAGFARLRGRDFLPPRWTLRYCGSTMAYTDAPDAERQLRGFLARCEDCGIRPGGFYLSSGYTQIGDKRFVFHWNREKIPDPEGLSRAFREAGVEFLPNVKPCFLTEHPLYEKIAAEGWFLKDGEGKSALFPFWGGMGSYLDFTNPQAAAFWTDCVRRQLVEKGYGSIWNDNNEYEIADEDVWAFGFGTPVRAKRIKPLFSYLMTRASLAAQDGSKRKNAVSRCFIAGSSRLASTWTGDNRTSFADFRYNHKMAMTLSLSGVYNFGQDIGGFAGEKPSPELFLRWIQYGLFTPRFVLHSWNDDGSSNMPWLYEEELDTVRALFDLRERLIPYLYNQLWRCTEDYRPVIYPLFLRYEDEDVESDCFFFGDDILVHPAFDAGVTELTTELPKENGPWYLRGREAVRGTVTRRCTVHDEPLWFVRPGSVLRIGEKTLVFPLDEGEFAERYLEDDGLSPYDRECAEVTTYRVVCTRERVRVTVSGVSSKPPTVVDALGRPSQIISE